MKKVSFICQAKGGAGKSVLTFLLASKYQDAVILDMDDATLTTMQQLEYRNPALVSFLNANKTIDRGLFSDFIEQISGHEKEHFICDLGASISEQLPQYFHDLDAGSLSELMGEHGIELELVCVVGGGNIFTSSVRYLRDLVGATAGNFKIVVAQNLYYPMDAEQEVLLQEVLNEANRDRIALTSFTISQDTNVSTQERIKKVLKSGKGIDVAPAFSKIYFNKAVKNLQL
jgi:cellulose biosynthesis protein BcsQ